MSKKVKVKVAEHHFKRRVNIGDQFVTREEPVEVEPNITVRNMIQAGNLVLVEGDLTPKKDEKSFQEDEQDREESEEDAVDYSDKTKDELKELCESKDLKKSGKKAELVERLKNEEEG